VVRSRIYLEGGGDSKELHVRCREGFHKLLERSGFAGRLPRLFACGGRKAAFDDFKTDHLSKGASDYVALLIDSEEPVKDKEVPWDPLKTSDGWDRPAQATDDQVFLMTTCMETWIITDQEALRAYYGKQLQLSALLPLIDLEQRTRHDVQDRLARSTRNCTSPYSKGKRSFEILGRLAPDVLEKHLPSFARLRRIRGQRLRR
jgi:hypothetical protein